MIKPPAFYALGAMVVLVEGAQAEPPDGSVAPLPEGIRAVWDMDNAFRESTPTRERICLNGLWRWQPTGAPSDQVPSGGWGHFKVPGCWPGITDYMQKDSQTVFSHPAWTDKKFENLTAAWYEREFRVPGEWGGRRIAVSLEYLNSYAAVFVDGAKQGEIRFPAGEVDVSSSCRAGAAHRLSILVAALPMKGVMLSYTDSASAREVKGSVPRRGLCGDVFLVSTPRGPRLGGVRVDTSVRTREITFAAEIENPVPDARHLLRARVVDDGHVVKEFASRAFRATDVKDGRIEFVEKWLPDTLWDTHTPQNILGLEVSLLDAAGRPLDVFWLSRFGFREFSIEGRDFFLNGTRIHLSAVPLDNAQVGAALATYEAARETLERLKALGINFVYTHNYDCLPGSHLSFREILRAADDVGMLVALTQPLFSDYDWEASGADAANGYADHAGFYARVARDHPSVVMYSMSHNKTGYDEDMNPDLIDGVHDPRDAWSSKNAKLAVRAEAIVKRLDPGRIVYHHASGNLGPMHVMNFYPNMVPVQELSDWFGHWATNGVKPAFMCEYGAPFTWDWTMYRGWFKGERGFGEAKVPWEFCLAEWNAQFFGDRAYTISEPEKANLRWEANQFRAGNHWHRWDYPNQVGSDRFEERYPVFAMYLTDNWRAFRTWGVSGISPWEYGHFWKLRNGVDKRRRELKVDWNTLQRPGFSPDYQDDRFERMDLAYGRADWVATPAARALMRNNQPLLGYIGGKPEAFTSKDHNFFPGERVEKQIILINDSRESVTSDCEWVLAVPQPLAGRQLVTVAAGGQQRVSIRFGLPSALGPGRYELSARFTFNTGAIQTDSMVINVLPPRPAALEAHATIAVFDPQGETRTLLESVGAHTTDVGVDANLSSFDLLIVGKGALTVGGRAPDISRVREGLKVIVFEQTAEVMEKRLGFRTAEYGSRQVFARVPDHPVLAGFESDGLRDWRGAATLLPPRLTYELRPQFGPTVQWCGLRVPRLWRCGNRGNVASVLIERPARGDFLSILDAGFGLHYSSLMEFRAGRGLVVFCQTDVTGRTESDPAAERLARTLLEHVVAWKPSPRRTLLYAGESAGKQHLEAAGVSAGDYVGGALAAEEVLVVGPGGGRSLAAHKETIAEWLGRGGHLLAIGIDQTDADALLPFEVVMNPAEHIAASFVSPGFASLLAGVGPADVHNRDPRELPLVTAGAGILGQGVLAAAEKANVVFVQLAAWQFDAGRESNLKRTHRRASVLLSRLLGNLGAAGSTPVLERFSQPVGGATPEHRWLTGLYLDAPEEWDDPYRFFRW